MESIVVNEKNDQEPAKVYLVSEVAAILNMKERSAYSFCSTTKDFIVKRCGPKQLRINKESFDCWLNAQEER